MDRNKISSRFRFGRCRTANTMSSTTCTIHRTCYLNNERLLKDLIQKEASDICLKLGSCEKCLKHFLNKPVDLNTATLFFKVLRQSFESSTLKELNNNHLSILMYSTFFDHINNVIITMSEIGEKEKIFLNEVVYLLQVILTVIPSHYVKVMQIVGIIDITVKDSIMELNPKMKELQNLLQSISCKHTEKKHVSAKDNFRELTLIPTFDEITSNRYPVLHKNIKKGVYEDLEHYLDVQVRLLREDFVGPLRDGFRSFIRNKETENYLKNDDFYIYENVYVIDWVTNNSGVLYKVMFDVSKFYNVNWEQNKRFLFGSLLCLSEDNFVSTHYATVSDRNLKELNKGIITVSFFSGVTLDMILNKQLIMLESKVFYGGYQPILAGLKEIVSFDLPFQDYILYSDKNVKAPKYLLDNGSYFDLSCLTYHCKLTYCYSTKAVSVLNKSSKAINVDILSDNWPEAMSLNFNESQLNALSNILSKEFSLTQGPPGTGKTYIGLQAIKVLCSNHDKWHGKPILIVCYTNHSLDQFLEGIANFLKGGIIRVGGRSSSEILKRYFLKEVRSNYRNNVINSNKSTILSELSSLSYEIENKTYKYQLRKCTIFPIDVLQPYMGHIYDFLLESFQDNKKLIRSNVSVMEEWLGFRDITVTADDSADDVDDDDDHDDETTAAVTEVEFLQDNRMLDDEDNVISSQGRSKMYLNRDKGKKESDDAANSDGFERTKRDEKKLKERLKMELECSEIISVDEIDLISYIDLWIMSFKKRWDLYRYWVSLYSSKLLQEIYELITKYNTVAKRLQELKYEEDRKILQDSLIIGMTTTGAARYRTILQEIQPRIIIVEEAAEILEAHIITSLNRGCEQLILIGDHKQLQPSTNVHKLAKHYNLNLSLFERMFNNDFEVKSLQIQHRMRPEIAELLHPIYPELRNHISVKQYENILGMSKNLYFLDHSHPENCVKSGTSKQNPFEASFIVQLCCYLRKQGYQSSQITILTTYSGQLFCIKKLVQENPLCKNVKITIVDNYQREENDIILLSLVRSNDYDSIGYLNINNRVCVALSRAKKGFYVIGNFKLLTANSPLWRNIVASLDKKKLFVDSIKLKCQKHPQTCLQVKSFKDFSKTPEGGCLKPCDIRLDCGHSCALMCHSYNMEHKQYHCDKKCTKILPDCNHTCSKKCRENCVPCLTIVTKIMPLCFHSQEMYCSKDVNNFVCQMPCPKELACGHKCLKKCGEKCTNDCTIMITNVCPIGHISNIECYKKNECFESCNNILDCQHFCEGSCSTCRKIHIHQPCNKGCSRVLICGHKCQSKDCSSCIPCFKPCENQCIHNKCNKMCCKPCKPCIEPCEWQCEHIRCSKLCHEPCNRPPCNESCKKLLQCGHQCAGLCGEECPALCLICQKEKLQEIFFGTEDKDGARFIQLKDCDHIFEVTSLDNWMNTDVSDSEIKLKLCPKCKTPIRRNYRYGNFINKTLQDIEKVKEKICGYLIDKHIKYCVLRTLKSKHFMKWFLAHKHGEYYIFTAQESKEFNLEVQRQQALDKLKVYADRPDISVLIQEASNCLEGFYSHEKCSHVEMIFNKIKSNTSNSLESNTSNSLESNTSNLLEMINPLNLPKGHWFKCKNGHIYAIEDCGGAAMKSICPECKCATGGTNYRLLESNTLAKEMDGASYPS